MQKILEVAEKERIYITYKDLQHEVGSIQGFYTIDPRAGPLIVLDRSLPDQPKLHRCVAAHELGHHFHPPRSGAIAFHRSDLFLDSQKKITISQDENKALRWATELLMPTAEVWAAVRDGYNTVHQLAECFAVTEGLAWAKIGYLRKEIKKPKQGGICYD